MIKIALIDNQELLRNGLHHLLEQETDIQVLQEMECNTDILHNIKGLNVDLLVIDPQFHVDHGMQVLAALLQQERSLKILVLSLHIDAVLAKKWLESGVCGVASKACSLPELIKAIKTVISGQYYLCPRIANTIALQGLLNTETVPFLKLSRREARVADRLLQGKSIQEISRILSISDKTANTYKYRLYEKLAVKNDVQLTRLAYKFNYLDSSQH